MNYLHMAKPSLVLPNAEFKLKSPLMLALDHDDPVFIEKLTEDLSDVVGCFKLGPRMAYRMGEIWTRKIAERAPLFIDCKFFDIPSTMESSVRTAFELGATFVTVHAMAGPEALKRLAEVEKELSQKRPFKILNVTILTSWDQNSFSPNFIQATPQKHVEILVDQVRAAGMDGIVCSPHELSFLKNRDLYLVTPGIRLELQETQDQKRVMGPAEALKAGASAFVVGRPILQATNPREAALDYAITML